MVTLLDVNVLVALAWPNHVHHSLARRWWHGHRQLGWATCPATQAGFLRVSSNRRLVPAAKSPGDVLEVLRAITRLEDHRFWPDETDFTRTEHLAPEKLLGHRQIPDAHLVALALAHQGRLATLDRGVREIVPEGRLAGELVRVLIDEDV